MRMALQSIVLKPKSIHTSTIIFLHGLGDTGASWVNLLNDIRPSHMKIICPTANIMPVTFLGGANIPAWFDIEILAITGPDDEDGLNKSRNDIHRIIYSEMSKGISPNRIILGGFSQGGALALYSALTFPEQLCAVIILSSWLPLYRKFPEYVIAPEDLPIFQAHGDSDLICPYKIGELTHKLLKGYSKNAILHSYKRLSHSVNDDEICDMKKFIHKYIKSETNYWCCGCLKRRN